MQLKFGKLAVEVLGMASPAWKPIREMSSHTTHQGTLVHSELSSLKWSWLKERNWCTWGDLHLEEEKKVQVENDLSNVLPEPLRVRKKPPPSPRPVQILYNLLRFTSRITFFATGLYSTSFKEEEVINTGAAHTEHRTDAYLKQCSLPCRCPVHPAGPLNANDNWMTCHPHWPSFEELTFGFQQIPSSILLPLEVATSIILASSSS